MGFVGAVVNFGAKGVQRNATFMVALGAGHFGTAETSRTHNLDALNLRLTHRRLDSLAHSAAESNTVGQLLGDGLSHQLSVSVDVLHLKDVEGDLLAGELLQLAANAVSFGTTTADHNARAGGVDVNANAVTGTLDHDVGNTGAVQALGQEVADLDVLGEVISVVLIGVPVGLPVGSNAQPEAVGVDFLAHY